MKYITILIIVGIAFSCSTTREIDNPTEKIFKSITEASYSAKRSGELTREEALKQKINRKDIYNQKGHIVESLNYEMDGTIYQRTELSKNKDGKLIKSSTYDNEGALRSYTKTESDKNGNIIEYKTYDANDELTSIQKNEYDMNGNQVSATSTTVKSSRTFKTICEYNAKDQAIKKTYYKPDGTVKDFRTFSYDEKGKEKESELNRPNGDYTQFISEYDNFNNLTTHKWYDKEGKQKHQNTFIYVYDKNNNWVTKKRFSNGKLGYVWERIIEYY